MIDKRIRDRLGIGPGWIALQTLVDDHVVIYFVGPEHNRSLMGSLKKYTNVVVDPGADWHKAKEDAWEAAAKEWAERQEQNL